MLDNIKIPSERKELLVPFFQRIKKQYGDPIALVHYIGVGILMAMEEVFGGLLDFICHFHFLRDVGKDLLLKDYQKIIKQLHKHNVRALLRQKARYLEKNIGQYSKEYLRIILNGCSTLAERFSQTVDKVVREQLRQAEKNQGKIPPEVKAIIKLSNLPEKISALFLGAAR